MELLDALSAEDGQVIGAVKMLNPLLVIITELILQGVFIFLVKVEVCLGKNGIFLDYFVENVNVQRQPFCTF